MSIMASDMSSLGERAFSRLGSGGASVSSVSTLSSKKLDDAKLLVRATTQATLAAKSILASGGTQETALKTAKAAAQATLLQFHMSTKGNHHTFLGRRKIQQQSQVVASMALLTATNDLICVETAHDSNVSKMVYVSQQQDESQQQTVDEDCEAKENAAPTEESPAMIIAPSPKQYVDEVSLLTHSPRGKQPFKLVVQPTRASQPMGEMSSTPKSILTPSDTCYTLDTNVSPPRMQMMASPRFDERNADDETIEGEPVYVMERRNPTYEQNTTPGTCQVQSYASSKGSSIFSIPSMDTSFETNQTSVTKTTNSDSEEPFYSVLSNMLKCGATCNQSGEKKMDTLTPHERSVYKAWKNRSIIVDTNHQRHDNDMMVDVHLMDQTTPVSKISTCKSNENTSKEKVPSSEAMTVNEEPIGDAEQNVPALESVSLEMYIEENGGDQRPKGLRSIKWRKALGLKPSRSKRRTTYHDGRHEAKPSIQQRTTVLPVEKISSGQGDTYSL